MSSGEVYRYFEVRFFSLVLTAIGVIVVCAFLFFFFVSRGQYIYAVAVAALAVVLFFGALELYRYAGSLKRNEKERGSENKHLLLSLMSCENAIEWQHIAERDICLLGHKCFIKDWHKLFS